MDMRSMKQYHAESTHQPPRKTLTVRQQQAIARRAQILKIALRLFAQYGFDGTSTKQIAREAGISEGLIFHYFPTKGDLLNAVFETSHSFTTELGSILTAAMVEAQPAINVLPRVAAGWLDTLRKEEAITTVMLATAQTNPQIGNIFQAVIKEKGIELLAAYLRSRVQAGELDPDLPVESSAYMFFASLFVFFLVNRALPKDEWERYTGTFIEEMLSVWFDGARA